MNNLRPKSAKFFVLRALIPYSRENLLLAFNPNKFFNELEQISKYRRKTLENALYYAKRQKLIEKRENAYRLTELGSKLLEPYTAKILKNDARLMIVFDIPESERAVRGQLRGFLGQWRFCQLQKSVWVSDYDSLDSLKRMIEELEISDYVRVFECHEV